MTDLNMIVAIGAGVLKNSLDIAKDILDLKAQYDKNKDEKTLRQIHNFFDAITAIGPHSEVIIDRLPYIANKLDDVLNNDYGSKVKYGAYAECAIEMFDDQAGILVNKETPEVFMLTSDNILACKFMKSKRRPPAMHTYFYYYVTFRDNQTCIVRMRRKYRDAMFASMLGVGTIPEIDEE